MFESIIPWMTSVWGQRVSWVAFALSGLLLLAALLQAPITWYSDIKLAKPEADHVEAISVSHEQSPDYIGQVPDWHLFGNAAKVEDTTFIPITSLQLRLIGIVQSIPVNQSSVVISEANQAGKVYLVGDVLPVGVKVNAITEDGVILENAGRLEKLPLQRQPLSFQGMPKKLLREE